MADTEPVDDEDVKVRFLPLTSKLLSEVQRRVTEDQAAKKKQTALEGEGDGKVDSGEETNEASEYPDYLLESGRALPSHLKWRFPVVLTGKPLKEIDPFYENKRTFLIVNRCRTIFRYSMEKVLWVLDPLNIIRRLALAVTVHTIFRLFMNLVIITNCLMLVCEESPARETAKRFFASIYTVEFILYVLAKGFVLHPFSYLRDPWHWLDLIVLVFDYIHCSFIPMNIYFGVLRAIRLLRVMGTTTLVPGMSGIVWRIYPSVLNLRDALIVAFYPLILFALIGLQIYMGLLTQRCIKDLPDGVPMSGKDAEKFRKNETNWKKEICGNASGTRMCPQNYSCFQGYGSNPDYGYTSFDTYGLSMLSTFCIMTFDFWENILHHVIAGAGPWHVLYFILLIFISRHFIYNLILVVLTMSYQELACKEELEEQAEREEKKQRKSARMTEEEHEDNRVLDHTVTTPVLQDEDDKDWKPKKMPQTALSKLLHRLCVWECCACWKKFQGILLFVLYDAFTEIFLAVCVIISTILLAMDHHGMSHNLETDVKGGTWFFAVIFGLEVVLKIMASSPYYFFQQWRHIYEFVVLSFTFPVLFFEDYSILRVFVTILTILRSLRLFRIFRIARALETFNWFITTLRNCIFPFATLCLLFFIISFIFAVLGVEFYSEYYIKNKEMFYKGVIPRWNFTDFIHSFMVVVRALFGEWIESMWDCMLVSGWVCLPFFLFLAVFGSVVVFLMFFVIVFTETEKHSFEYEDNDIAVIANRCKCFNAWTASKMFGRNHGTIIPGDVNQASNGASKDVDRSKSMKSVELALEEVSESNPGKSPEGPVTVWPKNDEVLTKPTSPSQASRSSEQKGEPGEGEKQPDKEISLCCPNVCYKIPSCCNESVWKPWINIRRLATKLIDHKIYEIVMAICVILSIVFLAMDDKYIKEKPKFECAVKYILFAIEMIFILDMLMKWLALGFKKYFTNRWLLVDFVIVVVSLIIYISWACCSHVLLKSFQSLRPLRLVSRVQGLRVYADAVVSLIPTLLCLVLFCSSIWLVFSIIGVALFGGKFAYCVTDTGIKPHYTEIGNRTHCKMQQGHSWEESDINYNNVGNGFLALWQIATLKGWIQVLNDAIDSRHEKDLQPSDQENIHMFYYFVIFTVVGTFFTFHLFASVVIQEVRGNVIKQAEDLRIYMTEIQRSYYESIKEIGNVHPRTAPPPFKCGVQAVAYKIISDRRFDVAITVCFTLNLAIMALDYYVMDETYADVLLVINNLFILVYIAECIIKITGLGIRYFKDGWNVFDLVVVILAAIEIILYDIIAKYFISQPIFLRLIKVVRADKVRRLFGDMRYLLGVKTIYTTFATALPTMLVIVLLQFIVITVYALFGVSLFKDVEHRAQLNEIYDFSTYGRAFTILFQLSTTAGWDGFLKPLMNEDCTGENCSKATIAVIYLISYLIIMYLIIYKLFTVVILQNYSKVVDQIQSGLTSDDYESFYDSWQKYDPSGMHFMQCDDLSDLLDELRDPLHIGKPNKFKIINFNIPIYEGNLVCDVDVMYALTKDFFARRGADVAELSVVGSTDLRQTENYGKKVISSTLLNQREDCSALVIQRTWNSYRNGNTEEESNLVESKSPGGKKAASQQEESKLVEIAE